MTRRARPVLLTAGSLHFLHDGFSDVLYVLLPVWATAFGLSLSQVGVMRTVYTAGMSLFQIPAGFLAERWGERLVEVDAPCSGLRMLFAGLYVACTLAALFRLRLLKTAAAVFLGIDATVVANILRATALFFPESGVMLLPGWTHTVLGLVLFGALAASLVWSTRRLEENPA